MRRSLWLFALFILAGSSSRAIAQARQAGVSRSSQYTLPANVVKAAMAAYKRHDIDAAYAYYDTVFTHQSLADTAGATRVRRDDWVRQTKNDPNLRTYNTWRLVRVQREVNGAWVNDVYTWRTPEGKDIKHFDLYEVRHGKIVKEIEG